MARSESDSRMSLAPKAATYRGRSLVPLSDLWWTRQPQPAHFLDDALPRRLIVVSLAIVVAVFLLIASSELHG